MKEKFLESFKEALEIEDREIGFQDSFKEYDEWDSLSRLSLIAMLDDEFDVQIEDDEFEHIETVQQLFERLSK